VGKVEDAGGVVGDHETAGADRVDRAVDEPGEEETEKLTFEELDAYWNIMLKIDPRSVRHAFEEAFIDRGLTNSDVLRLLERAEERMKWKQ
jgi:hypothetical protein